MALGNRGWSWIFLVSSSCTGDPVLNGWHGNTRTGGSHDLFPSDECLIPNCLSFFNIQRPTLNVQPMKARKSASWSTFSSCVRPQRSSRNTHRSSRSTTCSTPRAFCSSLRAFCLARRANCLAGSPTCLAGRPHRLAGRANRLARRPSRGPKILTKRRITSLF